MMHISRASHDRGTRTAGLPRRNCNSTQPQQNSSNPTRFHSRRHFSPLDSSRLVAGPQGLNNQFGMTALYKPVRTATEEAHERVQHKKEPRRLTSNHRQSNQRKAPTMKLCPCGCQHPKTSSEDPTDETGDLLARM